MVEMKELQKNGRMKHIYI